MEINNKIMQLQPIMDEIMLCYCKLQQLKLQPYFSVWEQITELNGKYLSLADELTEKMIELEIITPHLIKKHKSWKETK